MSEVITMGEPLAVFAAQEPDVSLAKARTFVKGIGGAELNVAIGTKRLGHSVDFITQIGNEPLGQFISESLRSLGVGTKYVFHDDVHYTGHQFKQLVTNGDPDVANYRAGSAASFLSPVQVNKINLFGVKTAHLTGIFPALSKTALAAFKTFMELAIQNDVMTTFDTNLRPALWPDTDTMVTTINELAKQADIVLPGVNEGKILVGTSDPEKIADFYLENGRTKAVFVKVGPKGCFVKTKHGRQTLVDGFKVDHVVDTVGAGDGFALGVITALLEGQTVERAALRGNAVGAMQVQTPGDNDGYPTPEKLDEFYFQNGISKENGVSK